MRTKRAGPRWVERLSELLFGGGRGSRGSTGSVKHRRANVAPSPVADRIAHATAEQLVGGVVELVGIAEIRARLGSDWSLVSTVVDRIAAEELDRNLGSGDVYQRTEDGYLVCFETLSQDTARHLATEIAGSIERRLLEQVAIAGLSGEARVSLLSVESLRREGDPLAAMQSALARTTPHDAVARPAGQRPQPSVLFQPIWPRSRLGQAQNRCIMDSVSGVAIAKQFEEMGSEDLEEALAELDCSLFQSAVSGLHEALSTIRTVTILIPIHFHSLLGMGSLELISLGSGLPSSLRRRILLDVIGIPDSAETGDLLQAARTAREVAEHAIMQLHPTDGRFRKGLVEQLWGASLNLSELSETDKSVQTFSVYAAEVGLRSYAFGANTLGKAMAAVEADFDYVAGSAVHQIVATPRGQARFTPLFGDPIAAMRTLEPGGTVRLHSRFVPEDPQSVLTLPDGRSAPCRVTDVSVSGARVVTQLRPELNTAVTLGRLEGLVARHVDDGLAVRFLEVHQPSVIEDALKPTAAQSNRILRRSRG